jgi:hypothetical protein
MQQQKESDSRSSGRHNLNRDYVENYFRYYFKLFGLIPFGFIGKLYSYFVCILLWFFVFQTFTLMFCYVNCETVHLLFGNITFFIENYKLHYLLPKFLYSLSIAVTATNFVVYDRELLGFIKTVSADESDESNKTAKYDNQRCREFVDKKKKFNNLIIFLSIPLTFGTYFYYAYNNLNSEKFFQYIPWIVIQTIYAFYSTAIFLYTTTYFNTICINLENKFKQIYTSVKDLANSKQEFLRSNGLNTFLIIDKHHTEMSIIFNRLLNIMSLSHLLNQLSLVIYIVYLVSIIPNIYLLENNLILFILPIAQQSYLFLDFNFKNLKNVEKKNKEDSEALQFLTSEELNLDRQIVEQELDFTQHYLATTKKISRMLFFSIIASIFLGFPLIVLEFGSKLTEIIY